MMVRVTALAVTLIFLLRLLLGRRAVVYLRIIGFSLLLQLERLLLLLSESRWPLVLLAVLCLVYGGGSRDHRADDRNDGEPGDDTDGSASSVEIERVDGVLEGVPVASPRTN